MLYTNIKRLREDKEVSQAQVARYLHCTQRAYSYYENGERDIPTEVLILLAKYYNVSTDYLLGLTDKVKTTNKK